jgi:hypothetical protein
MDITTDTMGFVESDEVGNLNDIKQPCLVVRNVETWQWDGAAWEIKCTRSLTLDNDTQTTLFPSTLQILNMYDIISYIQQ